MRRFWEIVIYATGTNRFYCFPFMLLFRIITPLYQYFSRWNLQKRSGRQSREWQARVISVGNITVGGSGKTPVVMWLARRFIESGKKTAIVHSGYGRSRDNDVLIDYGRASEYHLSETGDEIAMMAVVIPGAAFAIGRDKKKVLKACDEKCHPDVILVDDGYQRLDIAKDVDIAVVNRGMLEAIAGGGGPKIYRLFPAGVMREKIEALGRADAVFVVGTRGDYQEDEAVIKKYNDKAKTVAWEMAFSGAVCGGREIALEELRQRRLFLLAGIGSYGRLLRMLEGEAIKLAGDYNFGDHASYDKSDIAHIHEMAKAAGADAYLTTAKDHVKLVQMEFDLPLYCLQLKVEPEAPQKVDKLIGLEVS